jgi:hypothetical protein
MFGLRVVATSCVELLLKSQKLISDVQRVRLGGGQMGLWKGGFNDFD